MCGIIGIVATTNVNQMLYDGLTMLQHRGQDAAGMATYHSDQICIKKSVGMVRDVFHTRHMLTLLGNIGIGHVRYPTAGNFANEAEAQPFYINCPYGIALAHNGNLINAEQLKNKLFREDLRHINTDSDSELLINVFGHELQKVSLNGSAGVINDVFTAIDEVHKTCVGGYAVIALIVGVGLVAFRDRNGIRPLCLGERTTLNGDCEIIVASESVALTALGFTLKTDIQPAQAVLITEQGKIYFYQNQQIVQSYSPCIFEHVYLARPDSIIDGMSVVRGRMRLGVALGKKIQRTWSRHNIDVVIPVPDTSRTAAMELANVLRVEYREGFVRNRYVPRTFIMPGQNIRKKSVRQKLNIVEHEFSGNNVLIVDDSIVRGTTAKEIVQMAREAGARSVYFASSSPPVRYQNVYGIDLPTRQELVAYNSTEHDIAVAIGADKVIYQDLDDMIQAIRTGNPQITQFDTSCFTGEYVTGNVQSDYLNGLEQRHLQPVV